MARNLELVLGCRMCGTTQPSIWVDRDDLAAWQRGEGHIQNLLPYLSAEEREMILSQVCGTCFDRIFPDDEE
jgi:hypothetical protein